MGAEPSLIQVARRVLEEHTAATVDNETGEYRGDAFVIKRKGKDVILDAQSANVLVTIYDGLSEKNQNRIPELVERLGVEALVVRIWKLML